MSAYCTEKQAFVSYKSAYLTTLSANHPNLNGPRYAGNRAARANTQPKRPNPTLTTVVRVAERKANVVKATGLGHHSQS